MKKHLLTLAEYNVWANKRITKFIEEAGELIADQNIPGSFPSIRKTLFHIWDAQEIWMKRLNGTSVNSWPSHHFTGTLHEALELFNEGSNEYVSFLKNIPENGHFTSVEFHSTDGTPYFNTIEEIISHVMNHSTFHRGQIVTMLRIAGFQNLTSTDLIRYYRETKK
jgi:uncharacterized damage-inducible protein DinB